MCITLITRARGLGVTRAGTEWTRSWPAAGKIVTTWNVVRVVFVVLPAFGAGAAGCAAGAATVVVAGAGAVTSASDGVATIAATRAASQTRRTSLIPLRR